MPRKVRNSYHKGKSKPGVTAHLKKRWEDPVYREKQLALLKAGADRATRRGVPDGMNKAQAEAAWCLARKHATRFIEIMEDAGKVPEVTVPGSPEEMAKETLKSAFVHAVGPLTDAKTKAAYQRLVLDFTMAKPESKSKLTLDKSEEWLATLAKDMNVDGSGPK